VSEPRGRILIVDDAGPLVVQCVNMLQSLGYAVKGATDGEAALKLVGQEAFDLVLVDYRMPGVGGFEVFDRARDLRPEMGFILITGYGSSDVVEDATDRGFAGVLLKPFTREQLRKSVEEALARRG
jgi:CheY-like chemotaxis protein